MKSQSIKQERVFPYTSIQNNKLSLSNEINNLKIAAKIRFYRPQQANKELNCP